MPGTSEVSQSETSLRLRHMFSPSTSHNLGRRSGAGRMSDPPGRQVLAEGTFIPGGLRPGGGEGVEGMSWFVEQIHADCMRQAAGPLAQRGFENVQACELAEAMRMSVGSLYRHYGSKLGLALAVREHTERDLSFEAYMAFSMHHRESGDAFAPAFFALWERLVRYALTQPDLFGFTFLHWHAHEYGPHSPVAPMPDSPGALFAPQSSGGATRAYVREVLETGEKEGALVPGAAVMGEGLVWGTLLELVRSARQGVRVGREESIAAARVLWRALAVVKDSGSQGTGTPPSGSEEASSQTTDGLATASVSFRQETPVACSHPASEARDRQQLTPVAAATDSPCSSDAARTLAPVVGAGHSAETRAAPLLLQAPCAGENAAEVSCSRTRAGWRRSTRDEVGVLRPHGRTSPSAPIPVHPIERIECSDRARRHLSRTPSRASRRPGCSTDGPHCSPCCCRREPGHSRAKSAPSSRRSAWPPDGGSRLSAKPRTPPRRTVVPSARASLSPGYSLRLARRLPLPPSQGRSLSRKRSPLLPGCSLRLSRRLLLPPSQGRSLSRKRSPPLPGCSLRLSRRLLLPPSQGSPLSRKRSPPLPRCSLRLSRKVLLPPRQEEPLAREGTPLPLGQPRLPQRVSLPLGRVSLLTSGRFPLSSGQPLLPLRVSLPLDRVRLLTSGSCPLPLRQPLLLRRGRPLRSQGGPHSRRRTPLPPV
jgi:AcrR family transcriptional regulator